MSSLGSKEALGLSENLKTNIFKNFMPQVRKKTPIPNLNRFSNRCICKKSRDNESNAFFATLILVKIH